MVKKISETALDSACHLDDLISAAAELVPTLRERAPEAENLRRMPDATVTDLKRAGMHKIYMPKRYGGFEMDWGAHWKVSREIGRGCGSTAWTVGLVFSHVMWIARFPPDAQEEFFSTHKDPIVATGSAGGGGIEGADGGYVLNGRWGFLSGVHHADCVMVVAKLGDAKMFSHFLMLMPDQYKIEDTWYSEGLSGTGSTHITVTDAFVPAYRVLELEHLLGPNPPGSVLHDSYIYKVRTPPYQKSWFSGVLAGISLGALEQYCDLTKARRGQMFKESIADQVPVQVRVGESVAEIEAANMIFDNYNRVLHENGSSGNLELSGDSLLKSKRDMTFGAQLCLSACDRLSGMMGVTGQTGDNPVQRHFRDCRTITTHIELNWDHTFSPTGKHRLGLSTGDPLVDDPVNSDNQGPDAAVLGKSM